MEMAAEMLHPTEMETLHPTEMLRLEMALAMLERPSCRFY